MPWLELSLTVDAAIQPRVEDVLNDMGALAITLADADAQTPDESAIFEPGVGETPIWQRTVMQALFTADADRRDLARELAAHIDVLRPTDVTFRDVADQDWERVWMDRFHPMRFGRRLWVYPWTVEPPDDADQVVVRLDPGLAFGTGTHPTTALCMKWLDGLDLAGCQVIDYGCGSGVLAVAALKLGAARAIGIDNDPQALAASKDNAIRNGVDDRLALYLPDDAPSLKADVFVANILAGPLTELAPRFAGLCQPGAPMALSGILANQRDAILARYGEWFDDMGWEQREEWVRVQAIRRR